VIVRKPILLMTICTLLDLWFDFQ